MAVVDRDAAGPEAGILPNGLGKIEPSPEGARGWLKKASVQVVRSVLRDCPALAPTDEVQRYVEAVASRVIPAPQSPDGIRPRFIILDDCKLKEAFALPDGTIVISKGILGILKSEDELAALIAHEWVHIARGHSKRILDQEDTLIKRYKKGHFRMSDGLAAFGTVRAAELEADIISGCEYLSRAGYNPKAASELMQTLLVEGRRDSYSISHGTLVDRRDIGIFLRAKLNLRGTNKPLSPIPPSIRSSLTAPEESSEAAPEQKSATQIEADRRTIVNASLIAELDELSKRLRNGPPLDPVQWLEASLCLEESSQLLTGRRNDPSLRESFNNAVDALYENLYEGRDDLSSEEKLFSFAVFLLDGCGIPLIETGVAEKLAIKVKGKEIGSALKDAVLELIDNGQPSLSALAAVYDPSHLMGLPLFRDGIVVPNSPVDFVRYLSEGADLFHDIERDEFKPELFYQNLGLLGTAYIHATHALSLTQDVDDRMCLEMMGEIIQKTGIKNIEIPQLLRERYPVLEQIQLKANIWRYTVLGVEIDEAEIAAKPPVERLRILVELYSDKRNNLLLEFIKERGELFLKDLAQLRQLETQERFKAALHDCVQAIMDYFEELENSNVAKLSKRRLGIGLIRIATESMQDERIVSELLSSITGRLFESSKSLAEWQENAELLGWIVKELYGGSVQSAASACFDSFKYFFTDLAGFLVKSCTPSDGLMAVSIMAKSLEFNLPAVLAAVSQREAWEAESERELSNNLQKCINHLHQAVSSPADLLTVSYLFCNLEYRQRLQSYALAQMSEHASVEELTALALSPGATRVPAVWPVLEKRLEETPQSGTSLQGVLDQGVELVLQREHEIAGGLNAVDALMESRAVNSEELLGAALQSGVDEAPLLSLVIAAWWKSSEAEILRNAHGLTYFDSADTVEKWLTDSIAELYGGKEGEAVNPQLRGMSADEFLASLYRSGTFTRALFVRKALMNTRDGILQDKVRTRTLVDQFVAHHVDLEPGTSDEVSKVLGAIIDASTDSELCFLGLPGITERVFREPPDRASLEDVFERLGVFSAIAETFDSDLKSLEEADRAWAKKRSIPLPERFGNLRELFVERLENSYTGRTQERPDADASTGDGGPGSEAPNESKQGEGWFDAEERIVSTLPEEADPRGIRNAERIDGVRALKEVGRSQGAPGPRFLQLYTQCVPLSQRRKADLMDVHDNIPGQSKPVAYLTVQEMAPGLVRPIDILGARLGGGSLVTVYRLIRYGEEERPLVVKVLNPNAEARVLETMDHARRCVDRLLEKDPNNKIYQLIKTHILDDLEDWLLADIRDERFIELDRDFKRKWDGYRLGRSSTFRLGVPQSFDARDFIDGEVPGGENPNIYAKVEEEVEGKNLTQYSIGSVTDHNAGTLTQKDARELLTLTVTNYFEQLFNGVVHSNPHRGNFRLRSDGTLFVLDRNLFLEYTPEETKLFRDMIRGAALGKDPVSMIAEHLLKLPENAGLSVEQRDEVQRLIAEHLRRTRKRKRAGQAATYFEELSSLQTEIKRAGVKTPLRFTLLALNLNALDSMCKDFGLSGIEEAVDRGRLARRFWSSQG